MKRATNIIEFRPSSTARTSGINMAHHCVLPLTPTAKGLTKQNERRRLYLSQGEAKALEWHLQNPEFVEFLRVHLGVIVTSDRKSAHDYLVPFSLQKVA